MSSAGVSPAVRRASRPPVPVSRISRAPTPALLRAHASSRSPKSPDSVRWVISETSQPNNIRLPPEPGHLALGIISMGLLRGLQRGIAVESRLVSALPPVCSRERPGDERRRRISPAASWFLPPGRSQTCAAARWLIRSYRASRSGSSPSRTMRKPCNGSRPCFHISLIFVREARQTSMARTSLGMSLA